MFKKIPKDKLIITALVLLCIYLVFLVSPYILNVLGVILQILLPFIIGFIIAYLLLPLVDFFDDRKLPRSIAILTVTILILAFIVLLGILVIPSVYNWIIQLSLSYKGGLENIEAFIFESFAIDIHEYVEQMIKEIDFGIEQLKEYFFANATILLPVIATKFMSFIMIFIFSTVIGLYMLGDSTNLKRKLIEITVKIHKDADIYLHAINIELRKYSKAYLILFFIKIIEYIIIYYALRNENFWAMGVISGVSVFIPYIGGLLAAIIGIITLPAGTSAIGYLVATIVLVVMSNVDEYVITPRVYANSLKVSPLMILLAVFTGSTLYGFTGVLIAIPLMVVINISISTYFKLKRERNGLKEQGK